MCVCARARFFFFFFFCVNTAISVMNYTNDDSRIIQKKNNKENIDGLYRMSVLQFVYY